ncbi:MAG: BtpA/SgcQ family protein [Candidatus Nealsonbacteria bacterium]|nr:BtpA/SgcQ family protein [Candidatus Nealsonbacteria bacterium]
MPSKFYKIFKKKNGIIIGAIHFPPLSGYPEFPGLKIALNNALEDLKSFESGGVDAVIIENNYDTPHKISVSPETINDMKFLGGEIASSAKLTMGVSVLWNDYKAALSIAKAIKAKFIRIPVFVDKVKTNYRIVTGSPEDVLKYRKKIGAENVALFADIQVKHAELLNKRPIEESAMEAIKAGADAIIITGKWTGDAPELSKLMAVRKAVGDFPILVGSGTDKNNISELFKYANGAIVSTSLKEGSSKKGEINVKTWQQRISQAKVKDLIERIK